MKQKTKLIIILAIEFVAIITILLLIFFAGKKNCFMPNFSASFCSFRMAFISA